MTYQQPLSVKPTTPITPTRHIRQQHESNRQAWLDRLAQWNPQG